MAMLPRVSQSNVLKAVLCLSLLKLELNFFLFLFVSLSFYAWTLSLLGTAVRIFPDVSGSHLFPIILYHVFLNGTTTDCIFWLRHVTSTPLISQGAHCILLSFSFVPWCYLCLSNSTDHPGDLLSLRDYLCLAIIFLFRLASFPFLVL